MFLFSFCLLSGAIFLVCYALTHRLIPSVIFRAKIWNVIDYPDQVRRSHKAPTPRLGGVAIAPSFWLAIIAAAAGFQVLSFLQMERSVFSSDTFSELVCLLVAGSGIFLIGLVDDLKRLSALKKLFAQIFVATIAVHIMPMPSSVFGIGVDPLFMKALCVFWFVAVMNAVNLMDGIDGLTGAVSATFFAVMLAVSAYVGEFVYVALLAGCLGSVFGFLRHNWNPAKIFLGDCGSLLLGLFVAFFSLQAGMWMSGEPGSWSPWISILLAGVWLTDLIWAVLRRYVSNLSNLSVQNQFWVFAVIKRNFSALMSVFRPDRKHIHHRLEGAGFAPRSIALFLAGACLISSSLVFVSMISEENVFSFIGFFVVLFVSGASLLFLSVRPEVRESMIQFYKLKMGLAASLEMQAPPARLLRSSPTLETTQETKDSKVKKVA